MLSLFPELLFLAPFAAFFIRIALGVLFCVSAWRRFKSPSTLLRGFGAVDLLIAIAFFLGYLTQLAALVSIMCLLAWLVKRDWNPFPASTAALALVMAFSLLILGAGPFAFDLPL